MQLTWYGHAAFLAEGTNNDGETFRIGLDPYRAPDVGTYAPIDDTADIVALSHINEKYHSHVAAFHAPGGGSPEVVNGLDLLASNDACDAHLVRGVPFTAVKVWENDERREPIAMVGLTLDGIRVLHMGDCGHALAGEELAACGPVDVLLALTGAGPTIALPELDDFIRALEPRVVIPMHFGNDKINLNLRPLSDFLAFHNPARVRHFPTSTITITRETLPPDGKRAEVWVLPPAR